MIPLSNRLLRFSKAVEFARLNDQPDPKCRGAEDTFKKLDAQTVIFRDPIRARLKALGIEVPLTVEEQSLADPRLLAVLDYLRHAHSVRNYMEEKRVTAEQALMVLGDLVLPPPLPQEIDPFNGCLLLLDTPLNTDQNVKIADRSVFSWQSRAGDWREAKQTVTEIMDKFLPPETRTSFTRFIFEYAMEFSRVLSERLDKGEITLLQEIRALNAAAEYIAEQSNRHFAQLRENVIRAKAEDDALLTSIAVGLGTVATAAATVVIADANYRIANAETARAAAAQAQALAPIHCVYTPPGHYGRWSAGYINCR